MRNIRQNLFFRFHLHVLGVPVALVLIRSSASIELPMIAAAAMTFRVLSR